VRLAAFPSALGTIVPAAAAMLRAAHPGMDLRLTEAEPPEALRMLRAGYVDVALVFRHVQGVPDGAGPGSSAAAGSPLPPAGPEEEGTRGQLILDEPVHLVTRRRPDGGPAGSPVGGPAGGDLARYAHCRWIAGCDRCRINLMTQCSVAGFTPKIAFTTDDYVAVQALVAAGLGVATLPDLALRAARHPGIRTTELPGARRRVYALQYGEPPDSPAATRLIDALGTAAAGAPEAAWAGAAGAAAAGAAAPPLQSRA
jgi:DNA-binding transcriptional LysR family regulator